MGNVPAKLGRTFRTGAAQERAILVLLYLGAADRTVFRQMVRHRVTWPLIEIHFQDLRDDLAGLPDQHRITDADIPLGNEVLIVQRGIGHRCACQTDRAHHRLWCQYTGAAHLHHDILHHGGLDLRRIFIGSGPTGELGCGTQPLPQCQVIHFNDSTVNIAGQLVPSLIDCIDLGNNVIYFGQFLKGNHLKMLTFQVFQTVGVGRKFQALRKLNVENEDIQAPAGGDFGIQLPQRTRCGIPGIGKQGLPLRFLTGIELLKARFRHKNLTADNESGGCVLQCHGEGTDGFQVFRHVLANAPVATGGTTDEFSVDILQGNG